MATKQRSKVSSDRQNWNKTFNVLVKMLQSDQSKLELAAEERKLLEDRYRMIYERWLSDVRLYQEQIDELKGSLLLRDMESSLEAAKSEMAIGLKQREASLGQLKLDYAETDLIEFRELLKLLHDEALDPKDPKVLKSEVRRLRRENEKLAAEKNSEVSALLAEKAFVYNQYKILERDCANKLQSKNAEVDKAMEKVKAVIARLEQSQSSDREKDDKISRLTRELANVKDETYRLKADLDSLRNSRSDSGAPTLRNCGNQIRHSKSRGKRGDKNSGTICVRKDSSSVSASESSDKVNRGLKREREDLGFTTMSPKLFSSTFKVPKLKDTASVVRL